MKNNKTISELKEACKVLGLNFEDFVDTPKEIEKGVSDESEDYKALYEEQKKLNQDLLIAIGKIPSSLGSQLEEIQKGFDESFSSLNEKLKLFEESPMHERKSVDNSRLRYLEKGHNGKNEDFNSVYDIRTKAGKDSLKKYLRNKLVEEIEKGVANGFYSQTALILDSNKVLPAATLERLKVSDNILIKQ